MSQTAYITHNKSEDRWELHIEGVLKAYTKPEGSAKDLEDLVKDKGYTVEVRDE